MDDAEFFSETSAQKQKQCLCRKINAFGIVLITTLVLSIVFGYFMHLFGKSFHPIFMHSLVFIFKKAFSVGNAKAFIFATEFSTSFLFSTVQQMISYFICLFIPFYIYIKILKKSVGSYFKVDGKLPNGFFFLAMFTISIGFCTSLLPSFLDFLPDFSNVFYQDNLQVPTTIFELFLAILATAILPALVEEFIFRGIILSELLPYGKSFAVVASAMMFGISHFSIPQFAYAFLIGIIFGYLALETGSLKTTIMIHALNNAITLFNSYIGNILSKQNQTIYLLIFNSLIFLFGLFGIYFLMKRNPFSESASTLESPVKIRCLFAPAMSVYLVIFVVCTVLLL